MTKKKQSIIIIFAVVLLIAGSCGIVFFRNEYGSSKMSKDLSGIIVDKNSNKDSSYSLEILKYEDIENEIVLMWIDSCDEIDETLAYYSLYPNVGDAPLEFYLYLPKAKEIMGDVTLGNFTVTEVRNILVINITSPKNLKHSKEGIDLILHVYVHGSLITAAKTENLFINGTLLRKEAVTYGD